MGKRRWQCWGNWSKGHWLISLITHLLKDPSMFWIETKKDHSSSHCGSSYLSLPLDSIMTKFIAVLDQENLWSRFPFVAFLKLTRTPKQIALISMEIIGPLSKKTRHLLLSSKTSFCHFIWIQTGLQLVSPKPYLKPKILEDRFQWMNKPKPTLNSTKTCKEKWMLQKSWKVIQETQKPSMLTIRSCSRNSVNNHFWRNIQWTNCLFCPLQHKPHPSHQPEMNTSKSLTWFLNTAKTGDSHMSKF